MATRDDIETWIAACALGDRVAFENLYSATSAKLFGVCLRVLSSKADASDALQDAFVKIWRNADRYQANGLSPMSWLITIARNTAIDRLRQRQGRETGAEPAVMEAVADSAPGPERTVIARSDVARLGHCMGTLDAAHARAVSGAYLEGLTYAELAEQAEVPLNTMRTWLRRSLMKLKECLAQ